MIDDGTIQTIEPAAQPRVWYALRVKSNFERTSAAILGGKGYETYVPQYRDVRRWSDRTNVTEVPLFPGYVFARFEFDRRLPVLSTPGVVHVVPPHRPPIAVDETELNSVRTAVSSGLPIGPHPFLTIGQPVVITRGSMTGLEGILIQVKGTCHLVISVNLLQRSVAVEIESHWVRPLSKGSLSRRMHVEDEYVRR